MNDFLQTRPLSVIAAFFVCGLGALGGLFSLAMFKETMALHAQARELDGLPMLYSASTVNVSFALVVASIVIPLVTMAALYRDPCLGLRVNLYGTGGLAAASLAMRIFPLNYLVEAGLIAWMAYDLHGFNVLTWIEAKAGVIKTGPASPDSPEV